MNHVNDRVPKIYILLLVNCHIVSHHVVRRTIPPRLTDLSLPDIDVGLLALRRRTRRDVARLVVNRRLRRIRKSVLDCFGGENTYSNGFDDIV